MRKIALFRRRRKLPFPGLAPGARCWRFVWHIVTALLIGAAGGYLISELDIQQLKSTEVIRASIASPKAIVGQASVIDGDTLEIHDTRIRLHGVDAPETGQVCVAQNSKFLCGQKAALALSNKIDGAVVSCTPKDTDRYGRVVAVCYAHGEDLNGWLVANGWALAYRHYSVDYVTQEQSAATSKTGIWQGEFVAPWEWRRGKRLDAEKQRATQPGGCKIKGNISVNTGERIYHVPGGQYYAQTKISPSIGERWFCTEEEAKAAGWRRSMR